MEHEHEDEEKARAPLEPSFLTHRSPRAQILPEEGFISDYKVEAGTPASTLTISLKYGEYGEFVIKTIERISKPGCRVYASAKDLKPIIRGMGIQILSTPKGILSDRGARKENVGGEILAKVC